MAFPKSCTLCKYYTPVLGPGTQKGQGICRRHPPSAYPGPQIKPGQFVVIPTWPPVFPHEWCGEGEVGISTDTIQAGEAVLNKKNGKH